MISGHLLWDESITGDMLLVKHRDRYSLTYPNLHQNMYESLVSGALTWKDKAAIVDDFGRVFSFQDLLVRVDAFANHLAHRYGVRKGVRVGFVLYNSIEFSVVFFALCKLGAVAVPIPTKYQTAEITSLVEKARPKILVYDREFEAAMLDACEQLGVTGLSCPMAADVYGLDPEVMREAPPTPTRISARKSVSGRAAAQRGGLNDDCILMFTSGTTSRSKGSILSNLNVMHSVVTYQRLLGITAADVTIIPMPMYHITGLVALLCLFVHAGGTIYLHKKFNPVRVLEEVKARSITLIHASPTIFIKMLEHKGLAPRLPSLRQFACGSANMPIKYLRELKDWLPGMSFRTIYGLTETTSPASIFPGDAASSPHIGSSGMPVPGLLMKVVDDAGRELPNGQVGELLIRGTLVLEEYDHLADGFVEDRWFKSGDLARLTDDGFVYITDRKKDMINRAGEKVWSYELENLLHECPGIQEAAIVGLPDDVYGELVAALVSTLPDAILDERAVVDFLKGKVAKYKIPSVVRFAGEIPRTATGKVDKIAIRRLMESAGAGTAGDGG